MDYFELIFNFGFLAVLLLLGLFAGGYAERKHLRSLADREATNGGFLISQVRSYPGAIAGGSPPTLLVSEVVIASDYLKSFLSQLRKIFGGEMRSYHMLAVRARREALQQLVEQARSQGYNSLCNVRFDSADVGGNSKRRGMPMVAVLASATAYHGVATSHEQA